MQNVKFLIGLMLLLLMNGCLATRVVTVPMRVAGEAVGFVPLVGGIAEGAVDTTAGAIDLVPL